ncbi:MAG: cupin domain-containing protein [Acidimicrobiaceae bacterium]|nr:cupin domain-containing protein [Acidimicrobiaceae bacterium]
MKIISPNQEQGSTRTAGPTFTGTVYLFMTMPTTDGVTINNVCFSPGARTFWHSHEHGQILMVLAGKGLVQAEGEPAREIYEGDTVWVPSGERHWHGASKDNYMTHKAISMGNTHWGEEVAAND